MNQAIWGAGWSAIKYPQRQMGPVTLDLWTLGISVLALYPFVRHALAAKPLTYWGNSRELTRRDYFDYAIMGFLGLTGMTLLYNWGAGRSLASNGALISMTVPILTALIAVIFLSEKISVGRIISLIISLAGVTIISGIQWTSLDFLGGHLSGDLLLFGGAFCNAIYVVMSKRLLSIATPIVLLFWAQMLGFLGTLPFLIVERPDFHAVLGYEWQTWVSVIFLGVVYFAFAMIVFYRILTRLDAGQIMVSNYLQPLFGILTAVILLQEQVTMALISGGVLVIAGTALATYEDSWKERRRILPDDSRTPPVSQIGD